MTYARTTRKIPPAMLVVALSLCELAQPPPAWAQAQDLLYTPIDIGVWAGPRFTDNAPLNEAGHAAGRGAQAYRWVNGTTTNLGLLPQGTFSNPFGMNDKGQIVGTASVNNNLNDTRPFLWQDGSMQDLGQLSPGGSTGTAYAINDKGDVVGESIAATNTGQQLHAFRWRGGTLTDLGTLPMGTQDGSSSARGINERGWIVGESTVLLPGDIVQTHAFKRVGAVMEDLGTLPGGTTSSAHDINNLGQVVGWSTTSSGQTHAVIWDTGGIIDLGTLGGTESVAEGINDLGQIVGYSTIGASFVAFLHENTVMKNLNTLTDTSAFFSLTLTRATGINNRGDIVGLGSTGSRRTILLRKLCRDTDGDNNPDDDGDALCDNWETDGIDVDGDGGIDLRLYDINKNGVIDPGEQADPNHKDLYVEIDWMELHQPEPEVLAQVVQSYAAAPVANPDGVNGIRLHLLADEQAVAHSDQLSFANDPGGPGTPHFDEVKGNFFGTALERGSQNAVKRLAAKRLAFRYNLFVHNRPGTDSSGRAELPGNDFMVSLGSSNVVAGHRRGTVAKQAATLMHEFGHTLNLRHGGLDNFNCKPNYLSIMSYSRQFEGIPVPGRPLDFSSVALPPLVEGALIEQAGIGGPAGSMTAVGPTPIGVVPGDAPIDWNVDLDDTDINVMADVNELTSEGCNGEGAVLFGHDDWSALVYDFRASSDFAEGVHDTVETETDEMTMAEALELSPDSDADGITNLLDNCMAVPNAAQADHDGDGIGTACDNCRVTFNPGQADADHNGIGDACPAPLDTDGDGIADPADNCLNLSNPTQLDADTDGYGNACDADLNNSGLVTTADFGILRSVLNQAASSSPAAAAADLNGSGTVTTADFAILRARLNTAPGPSGLVP